MAVIPSDIPPVTSAPSQFVVPSNDVTLIQYNRVLDNLTSQRADATKQLTALNQKLSEAKWGQRGGIRASIRNCEQQIRNVDQAIRQQERKISDYILALQGQDRATGILAASTGLVGSVGGVVSSVMGAGGLAQMVTDREDTRQGQQITDRTQLTTSADTTKSKNNMIMVAAAVGLGLLLMMKKK